MLALLPNSHGDVERRYPVIYMQDGHNLFEEAASYAGAWRADIAMAQLQSEGIDAIIVGVPNAGDARLVEYSPWDDAEFGMGEGDAYLEFLTARVKPFVDETLATKPGRKTTGLAGSSLGANISVYGLFARSGTFGMAAGLSPAFWVTPKGWDEFWKSELRPDSLLYLDIGGREETERASRELWLSSYRAAESELRRIGFGSDVFISVFDAEGVHHETAWRARLPSALRFLLDTETNQQQPGLDPPTDSAG